jgi:RNA polymerase-binding transcription factor DksA
MNKELYKEKLEAEKKILEEELSSLGKIDTDGDWEATPENVTNTQEVQDEADMADRAEDYEERSIKLARLFARLEDVNKSLAQIDTDEFGICELCKKEIEKDRMEANPAAHTCKECMKK